MKEDGSRGLTNPPPPPPTHPLSSLTIHWAILLIHEIIEQYWCFSDCKEELHEETKITTILEA